MTCYFKQSESRSRRKCCNVGFGSCRSRFSRSAWPVLKSIELCWKHRTLLGLRAASAQFTSLQKMMTLLLEGLRLSRTLRASGLHRASHHRKAQTRHLHPRIVSMIPIPPHYRLWALLAIGCRPEQCDRKRCHSPRLSQRPQLLEVPVPERGSNRTPFRPRQRNLEHVRLFVVLAVPPSIAEEARNGGAASMKEMVSVGIACASVAGKRRRLTLDMLVLSAFATARRTGLVQSLVLATPELKVDLCWKEWFRFWRCNRGR